MKDHPVHSDLSTHSRNLSPEVMNKKVSIPTPEVMNKKVSIPKLVMVIVLCLFVALFFVQQRTAYIKKEKQVRKLITQRLKLAATILPLQLEVRHMTQLKELETKGGKEFELQFPQKHQIKRIKLPLPKEVNNQ